MEPRTAALQGNRHHREPSSVSRANDARPTIVVLSGDSVTIWKCVCGPELTGHHCIERSHRCCSLFRRERAAWRALYTMFSLDRATWTGTTLIFCYNPRLKESSQNKQWIKAPTAASQESAERCLD
ncbi:hypothetical protein DPEC_G00251690 [Dallia pectoralis]|uniref:Uncharacterized protein n=1 Tax=Dallia pectoralis TaxID=75939 RepID=A0ACC2FTK0_DALPE|nr:hypothetical protein DPEC_G00251690 [Dallia pectoralis]